MLLTAFKIHIQTIISQCTLQSRSVAALTPDYFSVICSYLRSKASCSASNRPMTHFLASSYMYSFLKQPLAISRCCLHIRKLEMSLIHIEILNSVFNSTWTALTWVFYIVMAFIRCTIFIITWKMTLIGFVYFNCKHLYSAQHWKSTWLFCLLLIASVGRSHSFVVFACRSVADV